jgi:2-amino-4-hydroxy-6-hydroxymethyldihydropteridine diphosphokinase
MQTDTSAPNPAENCRSLIGLGANLPSRHGGPLETLIAALAALEARKIRILARSPWFESEPVPQSDQPWFINAAILVETLGTPNNLLKTLHEIEIAFGRARSVPNAARPIDLDLLLSAQDPEPGAAVEGLVDLSGNALVLPHPRLAERAFVLKPVAEIAPDWRHPGTGQTLATMAAGLAKGPVVRVLRA